MLHFIAQTYPVTQPYPEGTPAWAIGIAVVLAAVAGIIGGLIVLLPLLSKVIEAVRHSTEANTKASDAQHSLDRMSERVKGAEERSAKALELYAGPSSSRGDDTGGVGAALPDRPKQPPGGPIGYLTTAGTGTATFIDANPGSNTGKSQTWFPPQ